MIKLKKYIFPISLLIVIILFGINYFNKFSFRDITWNMTLEQVESLESKKSDSELTDKHESVLYYNAKAFGYPCELSYFVRGEKIVDAISLTFDLDTLSDVDLLREEILHNYPIKEITLDGSTFFDYHSKNAHIVITHYHNSKRIEAVFFPLK